MPTRKPNFILFGFAALAVLFCGYVGAYYAMVRREYIYLDRPPDSLYFFYFSANQSDCVEVPRRLACIFVPINSLDRRIRSDYWKSPSDP